MNSITVHVCTLAIAHVVVLSVGLAVAAEVPAWACTTLHTPAGIPVTACASQDCNPQQRNIGGKLIVLSVNSLQYTQPGANVTGSDPTECCNFCRTTDTCNAWVFCNKPDGCGEPNSCSDYIKSLGNTTRPTFGGQLQLPMETFGPYGQQCNTDGTWPYQVCSLKKVENITNPEVYGVGNASLGWTSGILPRAQPNVTGCPLGLTDASCLACQNTRAPALCMNCSLEVQVWGSVLPLCAACANLTLPEQQDTCTSCIKDFPGQPDSCAGCLQWTDSNSTTSAQVDTAASGACFGCVASAGPEKRASSGCVQCFNAYPDCTDCYPRYPAPLKPGDLTMCLECAAHPLNSAAAAMGCSNCYKQPDLYRPGCLVCLQQFNTITVINATYNVSARLPINGTDTVDIANISPPSDMMRATYCGNCAQKKFQNNTGIGRACYQCVAQASSAQAAGYCTSLYNPNSAANLQARYGECLALASDLTQQGATCLECVTSRVPAHRSRCLACIRALSNVTAASARCGQCWSGEVKDPVTCQACLAKGGGPDCLQVQSFG